MNGPRLLVLTLVLLGLALARPTLAKPMQLGDASPRWVVVQITTSPPGSPERIFAPPIRARLTPGPEAGQLSVAIPARDVERVLLSDRRPVAGTFDDFVWVFDQSSGHVVSAQMGGTVRESLQLGILRSEVPVRIEARLSTLARGGYATPRRVFGRQVVGFCADPAAPGCTAVEPAAYDTDEGSVNAVGHVCASWTKLRTRAFTSLGRARFEELAIPTPLDAAGVPSAPASVSEHDASAASERRCS